jgi:hypothetical protein
LAAERGIDVNNPSNIDADGYPLGFGKIIRIMPALWLPIPEVMRRGFLRDFRKRIELGGKIQWIDAL